MKNTMGRNVCLTVFGESHGEAVGAVIDGLAPGIQVDNSYISSKLALRSADGEIYTSRKEPDDFSIVSGVFEGKTTGTPLCIIIPNKDVKSGDYEKNRFIPRPGHADLTAYIKYNGFEDYRGGGHFSGRVTAAIVAAGAVMEYALSRKGIFIGTHISSISEITDRSFEDPSKDLEDLKNMKFPVLDKNAEKQMKDEIMAAKADGDSVGGTLETAVTGLPAGLGEPWFDSVEGLISYAMFSIPGVKGIEFGMGFDMEKCKGSEVNDPIIFSDGQPVTVSNNNGGINGGITNGMPVVFKIAVKPTPTVSKPQQTVDFSNSENTVITSAGRHDPCIVPRAAAVVNSLTAAVICDLISGSYGTDWLR